MRLRDRIEVLVLPGLVVAAVAVLAPAFSSWRFLVWAGVAAVGAAGVSTATWRAGWSAVTGALLSIVGFVTLAVAVAVLVPRSEVDAGITATVVDGITRSWALLLTVQYPADVEAELVMVPVTITWLGTWAACEAGFRLRSPVLAVLPVMLAVVGASMFVVDEPPSLAAIAALGGACLLWMLVAANRLRADVTHGAAAASHAVEGVDRGSRRLFSLAGRLLLGLPVVVVTVLAGALVASLVPLRADPYDPREHQERPLLLDETLSPLSRLSAQLRDDDVEVFRVRVSSSELTIDRIPVAVLESYDGAVWTTDHPFVRSGRTLPRSVVPGVRTATVVQDYELLDVTPPFLPAVLRPTEVDLESFRVDGQAGQLASDDDDLDGLRYRVVSEVPAPTEAQVADASPGFPSDLSQLAEPPPDAPAALQGILAELDGAGRPAEQLGAIERFLSQSPNRFAHRVESVPGHSVGRVRSFLEGDVGLGAGTAEQFTAAFALLARAAGYPTRVAVGYLVDADRLAAGDTVTVHSTDAHAWPEVYLDGVGWTVWDPTPKDRSDSVPEQRSEDEQGERPADEQPEEADLEVVPQVVLEDEQAARRPGEEPGVHPLVLVAAGLVALVVLAIGGVLVRKAARRRRRRRRGMPADRILGAWAELVDRLTEAGVPPDPTRTPLELTRRHRAGFGEAAAGLDRLGLLVDLAIYARAQPTDDDVATAWADELGLERAMRRQASLAQRVRRRLSPRPFRRWRARPDRRGTVPADDLEPMPRPADEPVAAGTAPFNNS